MNDIQAIYEQIEQLREDLHVGKLEDSDNHPIGNDICDKFLRYLEYKLDSGDEKAMQFLYHLNAFVAGATYSQSLFFESAEEIFTNS